MGQVALGFRSLLTKAAIFFVMAALLAWALGGTLWPRLWPRPHVVDYPALTVGDADWWWRMSVGGRNGDLPRWTMMREYPPRRGRPNAMVSAAGEFDEIAGPVVWDGKVAFAGRHPVDHESSGWRLYIFIEESFAMPDRLAVEQQLARFAAGLPVQDYETIIRQRSTVLDPADDDSLAGAKGSRD